MSEGSSTNRKIVRLSGANWDMKCWVNNIRADKGSQTYNLHWLAGSTLLSEEHKQNLYLFEMLPPEVLRQGWLFKQLLCHWQTASTPHRLVCRIILKISHQRNLGTVTTGNEGYHRGRHFCRNLCFRGVIWPTHPTPLITHSPVIWAGLTCTTVEIQPREPLLVRHAPSTVA